MVRLWGPPKPRSPRYKYDMGDGVFIESVFPDFNVTIPEGMTRRFKPAPEETTERKPTAD